jgi:hypothetical protein
MLDPSIITYFSLSFFNCTVLLKFSEPLYVKNIIILILGATKMSGLKAPEKGRNKTSRMITGDLENEIRRSVWGWQNGQLTQEEAGAIAGCM